MAYISPYKKKDFRRLSWKEYEKSLELLCNEVASYISKKHIKVDAIVPILRGGAIAATYLSYRLAILRILPVQYKYFYDPKGKVELRCMLGLKKKEIGKNAPVLLLVEGNHCFGSTSQAALNDIRKTFPNSKIIYAAGHADYRHRNLKGADASFFGRFTNETKALTKAQCKARHIQDGVFLFPWESMQEEWETVNMKQYKYVDLKSAEEHSTLKRLIKV